VLLPHLTPLHLTPPHLTPLLPQVTGPGPNRSRGPAPASRRRRRRDATRRGTGLGRSVLSLGSAPLDAPVCSACASPALAFTRHGSLPQGPPPPHAAPAVGARLRGDARAIRLDQCVIGAAGPHSTDGCSPPQLARDAVDGHRALIPSAVLGVWRALPIFFMRTRGIKISEKE
jgi:hypothetical protein